MMRKRTLYYILSLLFSFNAFSQVIWSEDFGTGCTQGNLANGTVTSNGTWTVTQPTANDPEANQLYISATDAGMGLNNCGDGCLANGALTNRTLHVANVSTSPSAGFFCPTGDCGAAYDAGGGCGFLGCVVTDKRAESPTINLTGQSNITLTFLYFEGSNAPADNATVEYFDGTSWSLLTDPSATNNAGCSGQGLWTSFTIALPASANNNPNVKIGFRWVNNDDGVGTDPSFAVDDVQLSVAPSGTPPVASITLSNDTICLNDSIQFTDASTNTPTSWTWSTNPTTGVTINTNSSQNPVITFSSAGNFSVTLIATNASGSDSDTVVVTILPLPNVIASTSTGFNDSICSGDSTQLLASGASTYNWNMNEGLNDSTISNPVFDSTLTSTYLVTGTDAFGCKNSDTITITVFNPPIIFASVAPGFNDSICAGDTTQLLAGGAVNYNWNSSVGLSDTTIAGPVFNNSVSTSYTVTGTDANGCTDTSSISITVLAAPVVIASVSPGFNDTICLGDTTQLLATGGVSYVWNMNEGLSDSTIANPIFDSTVTSTYIVTGVNAIGCSNKDTITITVATPPVVTAVTPVTVCQGNSVMLSASGATTYSWNPATDLNDSTISNPLFTGSASSTYTVTGSTASGCNDTAIVSITVLPASVANGTTGTIPVSIPATVTFTNTSVNADSVQWNFGDGATDTTSNPTHIYTAPGTYSVTLIAYNANGCNDTTSIIVVINSTSSLTVPNVFSPNFDDINDVFRPENTGIKTFSAVIYDRWGLKIYEWDRPQGWWDGRTTSGMECSPGVYYFIIKATGYDGKEYEETGYLHLFR